jgi:mono/diheme cytochrome c family protein
VLAQGTLSLYLLVEHSITVKYRVFSIKAISALAVLTLLCAKLNAEPQRYQIGREVNSSEIALWDTDIKPSGEGLPEGSGIAAQGEQIYNRACAACHGQQGQGGPFNALVGRLAEEDFPFATDPTAKKTLGNYWPYATTIFDYIKRAMPLDRPGSLTNDETYALVAYLLFENELLSKDTVLNSDNLAAIKMPAHDRFSVAAGQDIPELDVLK